MKTISLTQGKFAQVDDEDYDWLNQWKWCARAAKKNSLHYYVFRNGYDTNGKKVTISMHRQILNIIDSPLYGDHIDRNPLNNQKSNLRICTHAQNTLNRSSRKNSSSKYLGVVKITSKRTGLITWKAQCTKNNKQYTKAYKTELEAAIAYNEIAILYHGEFANLNKI